jgi:hypothetical protein
MMVEAQKAWADKGVEFVAVSLDDEKTRSAIPAFADKYHVDFPIWTGASSDDLDRLHMGRGVPDTAFVDENGTIFARVLGEIRRDELDRRLAWATGDRNSPEPAPVVNHM